PQSLTWPLSHFSGVGAEETRPIHHLAVRHRVVLAEVMSLHAPAPGSRIGRRAEHCEMILLRIAALATIVLERLQHVLQAHDGDGFDVADLAQPGRQQRTRQIPLAGAHFAQRQPLSLLGDEVPVHALVVAEPEGCLSPLLRAERSEEAVGGFRHNRNRVDAMVYAARRALTAILKTVDRFARNQTTSQDRG